MALPGQGDSLSVFRGAAASPAGPGRRGPALHKPPPRLPRSVESKPRVERKKTPFSYGGENTQVFHLLERRACERERERRRFMPAASSWGLCGSWLPWGPSLKEKKNAYPPPLRAPVPPAGGAGALLPRERPGPGRAGCGSAVVAKIGERAPAGFLRSRKGGCRLS